MGRRIAYWRDRRGLTQADLGALLGQSRRWVQALEGGQRQSDPRLSTLLRVAEVLRIPLENLVSDGAFSPRPECTTPAEVESIRAALQRHDVLTGTVTGEDPPTLADLWRRVSYCCEAFQAGHYATLGRTLPNLIVQAQHAVHATAADTVHTAYGILSRVYQLTASVLHKYGEVAAPVAWHAADRALLAAERAGDPVAIGAASRRVAKSLMYQGQAPAAVEFATAAAQRLHSELTDRGALGLSTLGMLYLNAAVASSAQESTSTTRRTTTALVEEAEAVAERQGSDANEDWTSFGPTNVALHRVDVLMRLDDGWSALEAATGIAPSALGGLSRERRALHLITVARAQHQIRRRDDAVNSLLEAERLVPEEVRCRPSTISLVREIYGVTPSPDGRLRALAERCGVLE
ncbi:helix-turn-helix transcriptional regulator [Allostreptomyces psammosilenae]|uniref:Transcriptional regulator with XRE-family HTH domain n=1 Tax=Allostreptomyces psammosilenae TaxID=1892865 RepID=A0A853A570_9ACTN|nr:helix-turn-helix transcriptional regulator [Allostreptomyces psammosilenae]NYI05658.1 transcriptional regulator with XRE-family HTH domain [Allostreptomyces psammosilenae]